MIEKRKNCTYCGKEMVSATAKKRFCSDRCRVYYSREKERGTLEPPKIIDDILTTEINKPVLEKVPLRYYEPHLEDTKKEIVISPQSRVTLEKFKEAIQTEFKKTRHSLWKSGDPSEGSIQFARKYDCWNYTELAEKLKK